MKHALVIYALMGFVWVSYLSLHRPVHHYTVVQRPVTFKQRQAAVLMDLWSISEAEVDKPIDLFGEKNHSK